MQMTRSSQKREAVTGGSPSTSSEPQHRCGKDECTPTHRVAPSIRPRDRRLLTPAEKSERQLQLRQLEKDISHLEDFFEHISFPMYRFALQTLIQTQTGDGFTRLRTARELRKAMKAVQPPAVLDHEARRAWKKVARDSKLLSMLCECEVPTIVNADNLRTTLRLPGRVASEALIRLLRASFPLITGQDFDKDITGSDLGDDKSV